jgi:hypothetical protein
MPMPCGVKIESIVDKEGRMSGFGADLVVVIALLSRRAGGQWRRGHL